MQLKMQTDYAIRILLYLSQVKSPVVARELSCNLGIAGNYLPKITQQLRRIGWVESTSGINGGFRLLVRPEDISLLDVMREMESSVYINRRLEKDTYCSTDVAAICPVYRLYMGFQFMMEWHFSSVSIGDLSGNAGDQSVDDFLFRLEKDIKQVVGGRCTQSSGSTQIRPNSQDF